MKYCCDRFEKLIKKYPSTLYVYSKSRGGDDLWYLDIDIQEEQAHDSIQVDYCPFCGRKSCVA